MQAISLDLAKRIAEGYRLLGVEAPKAGRYICLNVAGSEWDGDITQGPIVRVVWRYTAAEIFDALPVGTTIRKCQINEKLSWYSIILPPKYKAPVFFHDILCEGLGMVLERVLDKMRREKGK